MGCGFGDGSWVMGLVGLSWVWMVVGFVVAVVAIGIGVRLGYDGGW